MEEDIQLYCNLDGEGNIRESVLGEKIVQTQSFDFFRMVDKETAANIDDYKVIVEGFSLKLVKKDEVTSL